MNISTTDTMNRLNRLASVRLTDIENNQRADDAQQMIWHFAMVAPLLPMAADSVKTDLDPDEYGCDMDSLEERFGWNTPVAMAVEDALRNSALIKYWFDVVEAVK